MKDDSQLILRKLERLLTKIKETSLLQKELYIKKPKQGLKLQIALKVLDHSEPLREFQRMILDLLEEETQEIDSKIDCCFLVLSIEALKIDYRRGLLPHEGSLKKFESLL